MGFLEKLFGRRRRQSPGEGYTAGEAGGVGTVTCTACFKRTPLPRQNPASGAPVMGQCKASGLL